MNTSTEHILLIATVGGTPQPLTTSLKHWQPDRIRFVTTSQTKDLVTQDIIPMAQTDGFTIGPGIYDCLILNDPQDFSACVETLKTLDHQVAEWANRGNHFKTIVDLTGGTKCMSAALALCAHRWPCQFSYIGGSDRTKDGIGVVICGTEQVRFSQNPWDALGYQSIEEASILFNQNAFSAAIQRLKQTQKRVDAPPFKHQLQSFIRLAEAYAAWECFDHKQARQKLRDVQKSAKDLDALFGSTASRSILDRITQHLNHLEALDPQAPTHLLILDLLANAARRAAEDRFDDAVARLYRATEALAQITLREKYNLDTGEIDLRGPDFPQTLKDRWNPQNGPRKIGLQEAYELLNDLNDPLGECFIKLGLNDPQKSPLSGRNQSILAHGFSPLGKKPFDRLWTFLLNLAQCTAQELPQFPRLPGSTAD